MSGIISPKSLFRSTQPSITMCQNPKTCVWCLNLCQIKPFQKLKVCVLWKEGYTRGFKVWIPTFGDFYACMCFKQAWNVVVHLEIRCSLSEGHKGQGFPVFSSINHWQTFSLKTSLYCRDLSARIDIFRGLLQPEIKMKNCLFTMMWFQTCMTLFFHGIQRETF